MDRACRQLLAGAALATDEDRGVRARCAGDDPVDLTHPRAFANYCVADADVAVLGRLVASFGRLLQARSETMPRKLDRRTCGILRRKGYVRELDVRRFGEHEDEDRMSHLDLVPVLECALADR